MPNKCNRSIFMLLYSCCKKNVGIYLVGILAGKANLLKLISICHNYLFYKWLYKPCKTEGSYGGLNQYICLQGANAVIGCYSK